MDAMFFKFVKEEWKDITESANQAWTDHQLRCHGTHSREIFDAVKEYCGQPVPSDMPELAKRMIDHSKLILKIHRSRPD
ncbi:hypothetical protein [Lacipirellula parvula]|uniref:Uncharacterized protein n=1 Tax=Lacipirellula parvula TaxID=2650471 RepID=A0A5K7XIU9_9BACT|nr:hypothetical protein [Lacipirellula parvula]BBO34276.1 hypothetical protein PLANPX_3888 [Lacipirellula parvula]